MRQWDATISPHQPGGGGGAGSGGVGGASSCQYSPIAGARAISRVLTKLEEAGCRPVGKNGTWTAFGPGHHDGRRRGLSIREAPDGRVLLHCFHGRPTEEILTALGLSWGDLFPPEERRNGSDRHQQQQGKRPQVQEEGGWPTEDAAFKWLHEKTGCPRVLAGVLGVRYQDGGLCLTWPGIQANMVRRGPRDPWTWEAEEHEGRRPDLWPLPLFPARTVWLTEGPTDCLALRAAGLPAYASVKGAGRDLGRVLRALKEAGVEEVVVVYDLDSAGRAGAEKLAKAAQEAGLRVRGVELPHYLALVGGKDICDLLATLGGDVRRLREIIKGLAAAATITPSHRHHIGSGDDGRDGGGPLPLSTYLGSQGVPWLVQGLIPQGYVTNLYGDSGQGKSYLALYLAVCVAAGLPFLGIPTAAGTVLYLDWELSGEAQGERLGRLLRGMGLHEGPDRLYYRRMEAPLEDCWEDVKGWCATLNPALVVVDSYQAATGLDPLKPQAVSRAYGLLRELRCAVVVIDHQARAGDAPYEARWEFASSYKRHLARSSLQLERTGERGGREMGLVLRHQKNTFGPRHQDIELVLAFREDGAIVIERAAAAQAQDGRLFGLRGDLMRALTEMGQATAEELALALDADVGTVRNILTSLRRQGRVVVVGRGGQSGKAAVYSLGTLPSAAPSSSHAYSDGVTVVTDAPTEPTDQQPGRPPAWVTDVLTEFGVEEEECFGAEEPPHPPRPCPRCHGEGEPLRGGGKAQCRRCLLVFPSQVLDDLLAQAGFEPQPEDTAQDAGPPPPWAHLPLWAQQVVAEFCAASPDGGLRWKDHMPPAAGPDNPPPCAVCGAPGEYTEEGRTWWCWLHGPAAMTTGGDEPWRV